ncbi:MAG: hypothetical protein GY948_11105 [Alphaproteobacteria bacterium]|nr:hypothetical protein [Alphaproteobacteria bacterium]
MKIKGYGPNAVIASIRVVQQHLRDEWISDGCREHQCFGCPSCNALDMERRLEGLVNSIKDFPDTEPSKEAL